MAKSGLRKVMKSVRGKHGTVRRAYYMKSASAAPSGKALRSAAPGGEASRTRRAIGTIVGGMVGAGIGAVFGAAGGAAGGAAFGHKAARAHAASTFQQNSWGRTGDDYRHEAERDNSAYHNSVISSQRSAHVDNYMRTHAPEVNARVARGAAGGAAIFGTGGAVTGGAFGAALGYAAAARLGRGGRAGRSR